MSLFIRIGDMGVIDNMTVLDYDVVKDLLAVYDEKHIL